MNEGKAKTQMEEDEEEEGEEAGSQAEVFNSSHQRPEEEGHSRSRTTRRSSASKENEEEDGDDRETIDTPDGLYRDVVAWVATDNKWHANDVAKRQKLQHKSRSIKYLAPGTQVNCPPTFHDLLVEQGKKNSLTIGHH